MRQKYHQIVKSLSSSLSIKSSLRQQELDITTWLSGRKSAKVFSGFLFKKRYG